MLKPGGGRFIPNFDPGAILRPVLGTTTIEFQDCGNATVSYQFGQGYGSGSYPITRLSQPDGVVCRP